MLAFSHRTLVTARPSKAGGSLPMAPALRRHATMLCRPARAGRGFADNRANAVSGEDSGEVLPEDLLAYRQVQMKASNTLQTLLQAPDLTAACKENINNLDQNFFAVADGYLNMAKKEGAADVVRIMESIIKAAMEAKQSSLRPEIQLLNRLIGAGDVAEQRQILSDADTKAVLESDDGYFFALLDRFTSDMQAQPASNPHRDGLLEKLKSIKEIASSVAA